MEDLAAFLQNVRVFVDILARDHERPATAIQSVACAISKGFMEVLDVLQGIVVDRGDGACGSVGVSHLAQLMARINNVKQAFRLRLSDGTVRATSGADAYLGIGSTLVELLDISQKALGVKQGEELTCMLQTVQLRGHRDPNVRVGVSILHVKPNMAQLRKQAVVTAFFAGIGIPLEDVSADLSNLCFNNET